MPSLTSASLNFCKYNLSGSTYSSKPKVLMAHSKSSPLIVFRFSFRHLSLALKGCTWHAVSQFAEDDMQTNVTVSIYPGTHSLVMKLMNSLTHSWTQSFASFAICQGRRPMMSHIQVGIKTDSGATFALPGRFFFMILAIFAMGRKRSCARSQI